MATKKTLTISLPKPCAEDWHLMTSTEKGRFCKSCQKEVIDFSKMSDEEILDFVSNAKYKFCGHFSGSQLNRTIAPAPKSRFLKYKKFIAGILAIITFKFSSAQSVNKQKDSITVSPKASEIISTQSNNREYKISGKINVDQPYFMLYENVIITIENEQFKTYADSLGNFAFTISSDKIKEYTILSFTHSIFKTEISCIHKSAFPVHMNVFMVDPLASEGLSGVPIFDENGNTPVKKNTCDEWGLEY